MDAARAPEGKIINEPQCINPPTGLCFALREHVKEHCVKEELEVGKEEKLYLLRDVQREA